MLSKKVIITNKLGLHARPAMVFVEVASKYNSKVKVRRTDSDDHFDGKSIMQLLMLAATEGTEIEIVAEGPDAQDAIGDLATLVMNDFDE